MAVLELLVDFFRNSVLAEVVLSMGPLWVSVMVGIFIGWLWKPKWVSLGGDDKSENFERSSKLCSSPSSLPSDGFGFPALGFSSIPGLNLLKARGFGAEVLKEKETCSGVAGSPGHDRSLSEKENVIVGMDDFHYLHQLVDVKDGGSSWIPMMDRSMGNMSYQAWRRDPPSGPPQYRSRTVFEDATPELVRDFFWDDEFRAKWDDMLIYSSTLDEYPATGTMVVHWIRKFPFFCSDREYIIGRRIWDSGRSYYCVTKGVPSTTIPRRNKPRRVDLYYSSWCIRAVESRRGDGQLTACEVLLFHYEDMGIPWEIAKLGVRQGMWGAVKKIEPGVRAYQMARKSSAQLSRSAIMAQINTMINPNYLGTLETKTDDSSEVKTFKSPEREKRRNISKILVVGGAVILACSLDRGLLTKAVIFGVARRFGMLGRRL